jgi:hypothetical protein
MRFWQESAGMAVGMFTPLKALSPTVVPIRAIKMVVPAAGVRTLIQVNGDAKRLVRIRPEPGRLRRGAEGPVWAVRRHSNRPTTTRQFQPWLTRH